MVCGSGGSKSRLAKAAGVEPPGQMRDQKLHAIVARSTCPSQNAQNTSVSDRFWKLTCRKSWRRCGAKRISESKCPKHCTQFSDQFWKLRCRKSARCCGAKHISTSKSAKNWQVRNTFGHSDVVSSGRRKGLCTLSKVSKREGFVAVSSVGWRGTFEEDLQRCIFRGRCSTRDMSIRDVRRSGRWFPESGCILEHQFFSFGKMILRARCSTSYDLASLFRGRRSTLDRWSGKIAKRLGTRPASSALNFPFLKKSRRIVSFLMLPTSKIEEVSQNCFVFDVVKFKNWGSLAEWLRFWCCQVQK